MSTTLRQVLEQFEHTQGSVSLPQMARTLGIERPMLETMIEYWVRKGKLREVNAPVCETCGSAQGCPFVVALPRCYELATDDATSVTTVACTCGSSSNHTSCH